MTFDLRDLDLVVINLYTIEIALPSDGGLDREAVINLANVLWVEVITPVE